MQPIDILSQGSGHGCLGTLPPTHRGWNRVGCVLRPSVGRDPVREKAPFAGPSSPCPDSPRLLRGLLLGLPSGRAMRGRDCQCHGWWARGEVFQTSCRQGGQVVESVKEPACGVRRGEGMEPGVLGADGVKITGQGGRHTVTEALMPGWLREGTGGLRGQ